MTTPLGWGVSLVLPGAHQAKTPSDFLFLLSTLLCNPFPLCVGEPVTSFLKKKLFCFIYLFILTVLGLSCRELGLSICAYVLQTTQAQ